jgi:hypothetical protein
VPTCFPPADCSSDQAVKRRKRSEFATTETELNAMAGKRLEILPRHHRDAVFLGFVDDRLAERVL